MKITKSRVIEVEEIVPEGTYYFVDIENVYNKYVIAQEDEGVTDYLVERVKNDTLYFFVKSKEDYSCEEDDIPYYFKQFILGISGKKLQKKNLNSKNKK